MQLLAGEIHLYLTLHFNDYLWLLENCEKTLVTVTVFDTGTVCVFLIIYLSDKILDSSLEH